METVTGVLVNVELLLLFCMVVGSDREGTESVEVWATPFSNKVLSENVFRARSRTRKICSIPSLPTLRLLYIIESQRDHLKINGDILQKFACLSFTSTPLQNNDCSPARTEQGFDAWSWVSY